MQSLLHVLEQCRQSPLPMQTPDGSRLVILPYGGRVLGLFGPDCDHNFLWNHPHLSSAESGRSLFASQSWPNFGGDRTWLAPEVDLFFPNFPDLSTYQQPRQLDPGCYTANREGSAVRLANRLQIRLSRSRQELDLELSKWIAPASNPLRLDLDEIQGDFEYAGYTQTTRLELRSPIAGEARVGLWNLLQLPYPGQLLVPTYCRARPQLIFGSISPEDLIVRDRLLCYRMRQSGAQKISIPASAVTGRVGYLHRADGQSALIVRNFFVNPSGEYVDVPWNDPRAFGYAIQACCVEHEIGTFNELEYHAPALLCDSHCQRCVDVSQVWAFRGSDATIHQIANRLLSADDLS